MSQSLSIVVPCYNESENISPLIVELTIACRKILDDLTLRVGSIEIVLVDDGSEDETWIKIKQHIKRNPPSITLRGIKLAGNHGQNKALLAGIVESTGDFILTMDSDLQHPPKTIVEFLKLRSDSTIVVGVQKKRSDRILKRLASRSFYRLSSLLLNRKIVRNAGDFRLIPKAVKPLLLQNFYANPVLRFAILDLGWPIISLEFYPHDRHYGESKYSFKSMFSLAKQSFFTLNLDPFKIAVRTISLYFIFTVSYIIFAIFQFVDGKAIAGWTSVIALVAVSFLLVFVTLLSIGHQLQKVLKLNVASSPYIIEDSLG